MTENDVLQLVMRDIFPARTYIGIKNVSWGFFKYREADLIVISKSLLMYEVEAKCSVSDLKNEKKKKCYKRAKYYKPEDRITKKHYAMPEEVFEKAGDEVPADCGVILIYKVEKGYYKGQYKAKMHRAAKKIKGSRKLTSEEQIKLMRLGCLRQWAQKFKLKD